jgi:hypothetical protein
MGVAETLGRKDVGVDALRDQEGHHGGRPPRRQNEIIWNSLALQLGTYRSIVGVPVYDNFGILQTPQPRHNVVGDLCLPGWAHLKAARWEQEVTRFDEFLLGLGLRELRLELVVLRDDRVILLLGYTTRLQQHAEWDRNCRSNRLSVHRQSPAF